MDDTPRFPYPSEATTKPSLWLGSIGLRIPKCAGMRSQSPRFCITDRDMVVEHDKLWPDHAFDNSVRFELAFSPPAIEVKPR